MPVMLPCRVGAGALEQARQRGEHRRRIALRGRRLADGEADLAPRHRDARDRVHHQQHVLALVAEVLGDRGRDERAARAHERGLVAGRDDHDRARQPFGAERVLDEVAHLAAALAEQRDHVDVGLARCRAIMPSSVLLPTPEPAKMPTRWPWPSVSSPSIARTPVSSGSVMIWRCSGCGGSAASGTRCV